MANSVDPDETAHGAVIRICTICMGNPFSQQGSKGIYKKYKIGYYDN